MSGWAGRKNLLWAAGWLCLLVLLTPSSAAASRGHEFEKFFSGPCVAEPCEGSLKEPVGVAVDETTGDVYVVDKGEAGQHGRVARFTADGEYLGEFNGSGEVSGEGSAAGSLGNEGEIATGRFEQPEGIAVDNSCSLRDLVEPACEEEDPSNGNVYVLDAGHRVIDKYTATGEYVGQITEAGGIPLQNEPLDGVAVDPRGSVWVYQEGKTVNGYTNAKTNVFTEAVQISGLSGFGLPGFAVDSHDAFYARHSLGEDFVGRVAKVDSSGKVLTGEVDGEKSTAVGVDQTADNAFIDNIETIGVFNSAGALLERLGEEHGEKHLEEGAGVGVNAAAGDLYVADSAARHVVVFGPVSPSAPTIESESIAEISSEGATLGAEVNPRSEPSEGPTEYHFEYGACATPSTCVGSGYEASVPIPEGRIGADFEVHLVSARVQGLKPNTAYHFKIVAHNELGPVEGTEATFATQGAGGKLVPPDGRGWELVSPPDKQGALIEPIIEAGLVQAAAGGSAISYLANAPTETQPPGAANLSQVLSSRGSSGWSSSDVSLPHNAATGAPVGQGQEYKFFDPELALSAVQPFGEFIPQLSDEASESTAYLHDLSGSCGSSCYRPLVTGKSGFANVPPGTQFGQEEDCTPSPGTTTSNTNVFCGPEFLDASADLSHIVLRSAVPLRSNAGNTQLYEWSGGTLTQVSVLPNGQPAPEGNARLGLKDQSTSGAISRDGARVVWEAEPNLYLRDTSRGETVQLDEAEASCVAEAACTSGGGRFEFASADGSRVLFSDTRRLTKDSGGEPVSGKQKADLYECAITVENGQLHCHLTDLTPKRGGEAASVQGQILGASEDGAFVYFVARGVLSEAANPGGQHARFGEPNLYLHDAGGTSFLTTLSDGDTNDWGEDLGVLIGQPTRVSPNGQWLELMSQASLTGYDNRDASTAAPTAEVYLYDASADRLRCASCDPTGARPVGVEYFKLEPGSGGLVGGPRGIWPASALVAANVPGHEAIAAGAQIKERYQPRYLNDAGRLFFDTVNALVSQDANNTQDVYEYEPPKVGDCTNELESFSERSGGCVRLISSGVSTQESALLDASESGDDVFFLTAARLSGFDTDNALDVYDAHVCADSPCIVARGSSSSPCGSESSCKAPPSSPSSVFAPPASTTFVGPGNFAPAPPVVPPHKRKTPEQIRKERLAKGLKACRTKKNKHKRQACERSIRKKYAPHIAHKPKKKTEGKGNK